eukprot:3097257-Pleurochrysis_carterae.AAC.2
MKISHEQSLYFLATWEEGFVELRRTTQYNPKVGRARDHEGEPCMGKGKRNAEASCACAPATASTMRTALSSTRTARSTSIVKSTWPAPMRRAAAVVEPPSLSHYG